MRCPLCNQPIHEGATACPHCDRDGKHLATVYEAFSQNISQLNDNAGILKIKERRQVEHWLEKFSREFPDCFLTIHCVDLKDHQDVSSYGIWALNIPTYTKLPKGSNPAAGICLTIDVHKKQVGLSFGYQLEPYFSAEASFNALSAAHPYLLDNAYTEALAMMRHGIRKLVRSKSRGAKSILKRKNLLERIVERTSS